MPAEGSMSDPKSYLSPSQISDIISNAENYTYALLFFVLANTGRRISEVVRVLKPCDIDFKKNLCNFVILKRKDYVFKVVEENGQMVRKKIKKIHRELLPINPKVATKLKKYIDKNGIGLYDYIFPMSRFDVHYRLGKACKKIGIETVGNNTYNKPHCHLFRHSFAIQAIKNVKTPEDLIQLQDLMGHARLDSTRHYLKYNPEQQRKLLEKMWEE